jgi:hypothetical protein
MVLQASDSTSNLTIGLWQMLIVVLEKNRVSSDSTMSIFNHHTPENFHMEICGLFTSLWYLILWSIFHKFIGHLFFFCWTKIIYFNSHCLFLPCSWAFIFLYRKIISCTNIGVCFTYIPLIVSGFTLRYLIHFLNFFIWDDR